MRLMNGNYVGVLMSDIVRISPPCRNGRQTIGTLIIEKKQKKKKNSLMNLRIIYSQHISMEFYVNFMHEPKVNRDWKHMS